MCFNNVDVCALYLLLVMVLMARFCNLMIRLHWNPKPKAHNSGGGVSCYNTKALGYEVARSFESTPQYFASLQATFSIWGFQCIFSSRIIPRKLKVQTFSIFPWFKIRLGEKLLMYFCELWNITHFVLLTFKNRRFVTSHSLTPRSSPLIVIILCSFGNAGREYTVVLT